MLNLLKKQLKNILKSETNTSSKIELIGNRKELLTKVRTTSLGTSYSYKVFLAFNLNFQDDLLNIKELVKKANKNPEKLELAANKLLHLVSTFNTNLEELKNSIIRVNDETLPELEYRLKENDNINLDKYLNALDLTKTDSLNKIDKKLDKLFYSTNNNKLDIIINKLNEIIKILKNKK